MKTTTPNTKIELMADLDKSGKVIGCTDLNDETWYWECNTCEWRECPMRGRTEQ